MGNVTDHSTETRRHLRLAGREGKVFQGDSSSYPSRQWVPHPMIRLAFNTPSNKVDPWFLTEYLDRPQTTYYTPAASEKLFYSSWVGRSSVTWHVGKKFDVAIPEWVYHIREALFLVVEICKERTAAWIPPRSCLCHHRRMFYTIPYSFSTRFIKHE